jgi:hypothetical protein
VKRLQSQQLISTCVGDFEIDENGKVPKKRKRLFGHVIKAVGDKQYEVAFDNVLVNECFSYILSLSNITASIPPDIPVPVPRNAREGDEMVNVGEYIIDQQEDEDLPHLTPEAEDMEAELETNGSKADDDVIATDEPQNDFNAICETFSKRKDCFNFRKHKIGSYKDFCLYLLVLIFPGGGGGGGGGEI